MQVSVTVNELPPASKVAVRVPEAKHTAVCCHTVSPPGLRLELISRPTHKAHKGCALMGMGKQHAWCRQPCICILAMSDTVHCSPISMTVDPVSSAALPAQGDTQCSTECSALSWAPRHGMTLSVTKGGGNAFVRGCMWHHWSLPWLSLSCLPL